MFGVSLPELIIIFVVVLVVLGPEKLPELARAFGKITGEFRKHSNELRREFYNSVYTPSNNLRNRIDTEVQQLRSVSNNAPTGAPNSPQETPPISPRDSQPIASPAENLTEQTAKTPEATHNPSDPGYVEEKKH